MQRRQIRDGWQVFGRRDGCTEDVWPLGRALLLLLAGIKQSDGDFSPVLAKHSKHFSLVDSLSIGVDRMQRNFEPMRTQVERWRESQIDDTVAKLFIYQAFIEGELEVPKHLAGSVHEQYFHPQFEEFRPRTMWSLTNAFTSAFKELDAIPQFRATAKLGQFLQQWNT